ncbi:MAG: S8 family serine peptidase [Acidimicrobiales bacterium]
MERVAAHEDADQDEPDEFQPLDKVLDPAAGHGTFIAGIIDQVAPGCGIELHRRLSTAGDGDEWAIVRCIEALAAARPVVDLLNLSFGGYVLEQPFALAWAIRQVQATGTVVVASAGNDGTCRATFPASLPDVVSVGAVGPSGPAPFSNYGPWVRACAPGVDLVSTFFTGFDGATPPFGDGNDPDKFDGWARWSGTSFAAPVVVGALARMMMTGLTAAQAVERVITDPSLMRIPNLGTVVNTT